MDASTQLRQLLHDGQYLWLYYRLRDEQATEGIRRRIRLIGTRWPSIGIDADLKRLMNLR